jgi:hypothetical protein
MSRSDSSASDCQRKKSRLILSFTSEDINKIAEESMIHNLDQEIESDSESIKELNKQYSIPQIIRPQIDDQSLLINVDHLISTKELEEAKKIQHQYEVKCKALESKIEQVIKIFNL